MSQTVFALNIPAELLASPELRLDTIFVQIASYRDPELPRTIEDCVSSAAYPDRLRFGICWQFDELTSGDLTPWLDDPRFRIDKVNALDSRGCCWARNRTNRLYQDETYTLQVDAHMRFAPDWDERLINMLARTGEAFSILSTYPPAYTLANGQALLAELDHVPVLRLERLGFDLTTRLGTEAVRDATKPIPISFLAAGLLFAPGHFCRDVEYDPEGYFGGEEIMLAVRAFSHGYKFFSPDANLIWHLYGHHAPKHWSDNPNTQTAQHQKALKRLDTLLLGDHQDLGKYGLGPVNSVADFEHHAGIDFAGAKARKFRKDAVHFKRTIDLRVDEIPDRDDYDLWVFSLFDDDEREVYRNDINDPDVLNKRRLSVEVDAELDSLPTHYLLWPHSEDGFGPRLVYPIGEGGAAGKHFKGPEMDDTSTIFVAIASYCEPELDMTLKDSISKARHPRRLRFGVCLQYDDDGPPEIQRGCLDEFASDKRLRLLSYDYRSSRGGCWARHLVQSLFRDERYTLQVDAHTRFVEDWDVLLIDMLEKLPSGKPLITGFPPLYFIDEEGNETLTDLDHPERVPTTLIERWATEGWIHHPTRWIPENTRAPRRTRVISGAFVFTQGSWNTEVTQDPRHYFTGEEFALTLRSFTSGYDLFNPTRIVVWHRCHPQPNRKHFSDFSGEITNEHNGLAYDRLRTLLAGDPERNLGCFSLGSVRSLDEYYIFSGLNCTDHTIHSNARKGVPPDPVTIKEGVNSEDETVTVTIYLRGVEPIVLPCRAGEPGVEQVLAALRQRALSGASSDRVREFSFAGRQLRLRESDLVSVKVELPEVFA